MAPNKKPRNKLQPHQNGCDPTVQRTPTKVLSCTPTQFEEFLRFYDFQDQENKRPSIHPRLATIEQKEAGKEIRDTEQARRTEHPNPGKGAAQGGRETLTRGSTRAEALLEPRKSSQGTGRHLTTEKRTRQGLQPGRA